MTTSTTTTMRKSATVFLVFNPVDRRTPFPQVYHTPTVYTSHTVRPDPHEVPAQRNGLIVRILPGPQQTWRQWTSGRIACDITLEQIHVVEGNTLYVLLLELAHDLFNEYSSTGEELPPEYNQYLHEAQQVDYTPEFNMEEGVL